VEEAAQVLDYAERLRSAGRPDDARRLRRRLAVVAPAVAPVWRALAGDAARDEERVRLLRRALRLAPEDVEGRRELAERLHATGAVDEGFAQLRALTALRPDDVDPYFALGLRRHLAGTPEAAQRPFRRAALLRPDSAAAQLNAGSALFDREVWREAVGFFRRALLLRPEHAYTLFQYGRCRRRLDGAAAARPWTERALWLGGPRGDFCVETAHVHRDMGNWAAAGLLGRRLAVEEPGGYDAWLNVGVAAEKRGDDQAAVAAYDRAVRASPGFGEAFTRRAMTLLAHRFGPPPPPRPSAARPNLRLASTRLGVNGRFGNQVMQYGFLKAYAAVHGLTLETPDWVGRHLFDADDPPPGPPLPRLQEGEGDFMASLNGAGDVYAGHDLIGFFCGDTAPLAAHRDVFRAAFRPGRAVAGYAAAVEAALRSRGETVVALHLRRGDFGWGRFWIAPAQWYLDWLEATWPTLKAPVLYIATDQPDLAAAFARYAPLGPKDLPPPPPGAEFFGDFHALRCADVAAISNSSFSFSATMLNERAVATLRPDRRLGRLRAYDPWSAPVLLD
jgi:tetratricopeptide (TPR) repeat protein